MDIKSSNIVRCMSHTNTDIVIRQRGAEGRGVMGQRKFCWPSFRTTFHLITIFFIIRNIYGSVYQCCKGTSDFQCLNTNM